MSAQVLTVAQMQAAEQALIDGGETIDSLMLTAGRGAADWVWRVAAGRPVTVLCGPGNNGGDGYVIAETLRARGLAVVVVAPVEPKTDAASNARAAYRGEYAEAGHGGVFVDCLFGSGLARPLGEALAGLVRSLAESHRYSVAVDLPSGVESDSGALLDKGLPQYDLTVALGAWKFAHWTMPAMARMGERRLVPIGVGETDGPARLLERPRLCPPARDAHKYSRGMVLVVGGPMEGAELLASEAAMRSGAGTVRLAAQWLHPAAPPDLVLKPQPLAELLDDERTGAVLVGPGLGRDDDARGKLGTVLAAGRPAVVDADALHLLGPGDLAGYAAPLILTPHEGEMRRLCESFGIALDDRLERTRALAKAAHAVVVAKGPDTILADPGGRLVLAPSPSSWLSVAGTGDVLAGIVAGRLAVHGDAFRAASEGVWIHGEAARLTPVPFTASELALRVAEAYAACL